MNDKIKVAFCFDKNMKAPTLVSVANLLDVSVKKMKIFNKKLKNNGKINFYFCGIKVFSYKKKGNIYAGMKVKHKKIKVSKGFNGEKKTLSIVVPCYMNDDSNYKKFLEHYNNMPLEVKKGFEIVLVDDCSPIAVEIPKDINLNISVYKINDDINWNIPGARNLGVVNANTPNFIFQDLDHTIPTDTLQTLINYKPQDKEVLMFDRYKDDKKHTVHVGTFFMQKQLFLNLNGCDEDFAGNYGSDGHLRACINDYKCEVNITNLKIDTYSDRTYQQHNLARDTSHNKKLMAEKNKAPLKNHSKKMLRFSWSLIEQTTVKD